MSLSRLIARRERLALELMDNHAALFWADDPVVQEIQEKISDANPAHGKNSRFALDWLAQEGG